MKRHSKQNADVTKQNKQANAPKTEDRDYRRMLARARRIAYLIHDDLHLSFAQCTQLVLTGYKSGHLIANSNIRKKNVANMALHEIVPLIAEFDEQTFKHLLDKKMDFAASAVVFKA